MKDLLLLLLQLVGGVCLLGSVLSLLGILWGEPMRLKGAEVPDDWRAAVAFLAAGAVCFGIVYLATRKKVQNKPD